jgi:hypothetical protein
MTAAIPFTVEQGRIAHLSQNGQGEIGSKFRGTPACRAVAVVLGIAECHQR